MEMSEKIRSPEEGIGAVISGECVTEVLARCEIGPLFERREWLAAVGALAMVLPVVTPNQFDRLHALCSGLTELINADREREFARLDALEAM